jgi:Ca2+-binding EF-hand superfamily protein
MKGKHPKLNQKPPAATSSSEAKTWKAEDYVSETMSLDEVKGIKAAFDIFDSDRSGYVDPKEMKAAFVSLGLSNANKVVVNIMNSLEGEHPQGLAFSDFIHLSIGVA